MLRNKQLRIKLRARRVNTSELFIFVNNLNQNLIIFLYYKFIFEIAKHFQFILAFKVRVGWAVNDLD